jgi:integrase
MRSDIQPSQKGAVFGGKYQPSITLFVLLLFQITPKYAASGQLGRLASSAEVDERYVQKQLGHASAEMTRRYQRRRDRFRVNLTKAAGL